MVEPAVNQPSLRWQKTFPLTHMGQTSRDTCTHLATKILEFLVITSNIPGSIPTPQTCCHTVLSSLYQQPHPFRHSGKTLAPPVLSDSIANSSACLLPSKYTPKPITFYCFHCHPIFQKTLVR